MVKFCPFSFLGTRIPMEQTNHVFVPIGVLMATDIVAQLADSLANTGVEEKELSYKGQGRKLDDAQSGGCHLSQSMLSVQ